MENANCLSPIVKWAGGKEQELKYILPNIPDGFARFIEPFVGGGAVYFSSCFCTTCTIRAMAALRAALTANSTRKFTPMNATNRK